MVHSPLAVVGKRKGQVEEGRRTFSQSENQSNTGFHKRNLDISVLGFYAGVHSRKAFVLLWNNAYSLFQGTFTQHMMGNRMEPRLILYPPLGQVGHSPV